MERPRAVAFVLALRPRQWAKNIFVSAALVFAGRLAAPASLLRVCGAFGVFCVLSSAVYLLNDVRDRDADRLHPTKRRRPIAAGEIGPGTASAISAVLAVAALMAAFRLSDRFGAVAAAYLVLNAAYSFGLKRI